MFQFTIFTSFHFNNLEIFFPFTKCSFVECSEKEQFMCVAFIKSWASFLTIHKHGLSWQRTERIERWSEEGEGARRGGERVMQYKRNSNIEKSSRKVQSLKSWKVRDINWIVNRIKTHRVERGEETQSTSSKKGEMWKAKFHRAEKVSFAAFRRFTHSTESSCGTSKRTWKHFFRAVRLEKI